MTSDISRGFESFPIEVVNDENDQELDLTDFRYVTRNCYEPGLKPSDTLDTMTICSCQGNGCSLSCVCTKLSKCWYNSEGCLLGDIITEDPLTIYECSKACHCPKTCINRVVQRGLRCSLQVFQTPKCGWGVRTLKDIPKGTFVSEYVGEIISEELSFEREDDSYLFDLGSTTGKFCVDASHFGNVSRFLNHSCEPNLVSVRVFVDHQDQNFPRIAFYAAQDIPAMEELRFDYGAEFWLSKCRSVLCSCDASSCKYSKDAIDDTLQSFLQRPIDAT